VPPGRAHGPLTGPHLPPRPGAASAREPRTPEAKFVDVPPLSPRGRPLTPPSRAAAEAAADDGLDDTTPSRGAPRSAIPRSNRSPGGRSIFGDDLISEKSLDEVILSYLADDLDGTSNLP
jgi:hypothetical protein